MKNRIGILSRSFATAAKRYDAVVIGAGPGGLTATSYLLQQGHSKVCMIDPYFQAGRIHRHYREVPSNTKSGMFTQWATASQGFKDALKSPSSDAFDKLSSMNQDDTCMLGDAIDVARDLSDGLRRDKRVDSITAVVESLDSTNGTWQVPGLGIESDRIVLATGSHPTSHPLASEYPHLKVLDLDTCLKPSLLKQVIDERSKVGVIGASHSAILALKNVHETGAQLVNFYRSELLFAEYMDGWILWDNTGLKGLAATWAREKLTSRTEGITRIKLPKDEKKVYDEELKSCTHLLSAIGFTRTPLPRITMDGEVIEPVFDHLLGRFSVPSHEHGHQDQGRVVPGLYGAGIAFPERVTDPRGHISMNVGWKKFDKAVARWSQTW